MNQQTYGLGSSQDGYAYQNINGDGMTPEELAYWNQQMADGDAQKSSRARTGGFMSEDEYYGRKEAEKQDRAAAQRESDWIMRPMAPGDANSPNYGEKYYKTLGNKGTSAVAGMPVPTNYEPPIAATNRPNDPDMMRLEQIRQQQGYSPQSAPDQYPNVPIDGASGGVGLSAMQGQVQPSGGQPQQVSGAVGLSAMQSQPQGQVAPTQVQTAQAIMGAINSGAPTRQVIMAAAKASGYGDAGLVQGEDGSMRLVTRGSSPTYVNGQAVDEGTQPKLIASFRPGKEGVRDVADFLHTVLTPQQQKANEGLVKYAGEQANRQEDKSFDREKLAMSEGMKTDTYNRGLAAMYAKELDAAQKAYAAEHPGDPFTQEAREAFDRSFDAGLARFGVGPKGLPKTDRPSHKTDQPAPTPSPDQEGVGLGSSFGDKLRSFFGGSPTPQPTSTAAPAPPAQQLPTPAAARLKEGVVTKFDNGQFWTLQNGQSVQVQPKAAPSHTPAPTASPQAMPTQQEAPQVGLGQPGPTSMPQYQGQYRQMREYADSGKPMDMAPQPAVPRSDDEWAGMYNTPIPKDQQMAYEKWKWDQSRKRGGDITRDLPTYDIQGAALEGLQRGGNGHFSDKFKKPSHEGFSTDSQYSGLDGYTGGDWGYNRGTQREVFTPSQTNLQLNSPERMMRYVNAPGEKPVELMENVGGRMMNVNTNNNGGNGLFTQAGLGQPMPMQPQGPTAGERGAQAVSSVVNPQRGNEPSADWQEVAALPEKLEAQYPGIVGYLTAISQAHQLPFNAVLGILTKGGEGAAKLWQGFQRARQTGSAY